MCRCAHEKIKTIPGTKIFLAMKNYFLLVLGLLMMMSSCRKDEKNAYVNYKITKNGGNGPNYTVSYTLANGSTQSKGPITGDRWASETVRDVKPGTSLSLSLEGTTTTTFDMM